jgi:hypothetical protein
VSVKAEHKQVNDKIDALVREKDNLERMEEERHRKRLETFRLEEEEKHRVLKAEAEEEHRIRLQHRDEAAKHEKMAGELLEKQLELRKYSKTIHNSLDAVKAE